MRRTLLLLVVFLLGSGFSRPLRAQSNDPSELFLNAYMSVQAAERLEHDGSQRQALEKYRTAATVLEQVQMRFPNWQPLIVEYRKKRTTENIARLEQQLGVPPSVAVPPPPTTPSPEEEAPLPPSVNPPDNVPLISPGTGNPGESQIDQLQNALRDSRKQLQSVQGEKEELAAKLEETLKQLDKSKLTTTELKARLQQAQEAFRNAATDSSRNSAGQQALLKEIADLQEQLENESADREAADEVSDSNARRLTGARKNVKEARLQIASITTERDKALAELGKAHDAQKKVDQLIADNSTLSQKLADAENTIKEFNSNSPHKDEEIASLRKEVSATKDLLAATQQQNAQFQSTISDLQNQLDSATSQLADVQASGVSAQEKKKYTEENDLLRGIVLRQLKEQARRDQSKKLVVAELQKLDVQSSALLQQIDYLGQPLVKLTPQEKALFKQPQIEITDSDSTSSMEFSIAAPKPDAEKTAPAESPAGSPQPQESAAPAPSPTPAEMAKLTPLVSPTPAAAMTGTNAAIEPAPANSPSPAEQIQPEKAPQVETSPNPNVPAELVAPARDAKDAYERGDYRTAEKAYEKMLLTAPNNVYILSNLGVVEYRQGKVKLAEEKLKKAIVVAPDDAFSYRTLGIVYYSESKYDEAVQALTKTIAINQKDSIAHNYLGITASQKGWQEAALKELETAIALDSKYADAYFNLAVIYATMQPSNKEEARKYYKRAIELGSDPDSALEQLIK